MTKAKNSPFYRDIESLNEYILVDTEKIYVEKHIRNTDKSWQLTDYRSLADSFTIKTVEIVLQLKDIYDGLHFEIPHSGY